MTFGHSPSLIRKVLGIDPKNVIHRACVYNVGLHNDNVPKHLALQVGPHNLFLDNISQSHSFVGFRRRNRDDLLMASFGINNMCYRVRVLHGYPWCDWIHREWLIT